MLEADDDVVGVTNHDHVARRLAPSPALGPKIEDVVKVAVREQRRNHHQANETGSTMPLISGQHTGFLGELL